MSQELWSFYIIQNKNATYAGVSPDPVKRLKKHNGEISGGAKYTLSKGSGWKHICLVHGFQSKIQALQFEWAVKHESPRNSGGIIARIIKLYKVLNKSHWTSKSPDAASIFLTLEWKENMEWLWEIITEEERKLPEYVMDINKYQ